MPSTLASKLPTPRDLLYKCGKTFVNRGHIIVSTLNFTIPALAEYAINGKKCFLFTGRFMSSQPNIALHVTTGLQSSEYKIIMKAFLKISHVKNQRIENVNRKSSHYADK